MDVFPTLPYTIRIEMLSGLLILEFAETQWHLPAEVKITGPVLAEAEFKHHLSAYPSGMWGYPIERLEFCSPMDIHANLVSNGTNYHNPAIQGFEVIGYIPDELPAEIHPDNQQPDEDEEEID